MKLKNVLMISFLAIAGIFGASSAIVNNEVKETPIVEKAEATAQNEFLYAHAASASDFGAITKVHMWGSSGDYSAWDSDPSMTRIGSTNTYYLKLSAKNPASFANTGVIFRSSSKQTGNITSNTPATKSVFHNFSANNTSADCGTTDTWALATSLNGWSKTANRFTISTTGTYAHRYYISYNFTEAGTFKIVNVSKNAWYNYSSQPGIPNTITSDDSDDNNFKVSTPGTLVIWMTPTANAYGDATYIYDNTEGAMTFTPATFSVTYKYYNTNGVSVKSDSSSGSKQAGTSITLPNTPGISVSGYKFYGWYTDYLSGLFSGTHYNGGASYTVNANATLYAKYVTADKGYVLGTFNDWNEVTGATMTDNSPSSGLRSFVRSFSVNDKFYIRYVNSSDDDGIYHYSNLGSGGDAGHNFTSDNDDNFVCSTAGTYMIVLDTSAQGNNVQIYYSPYQDLGYYMAGSGSFGNWSLSSAKPMTTDPSGNNTAIIENGTTGISVTANSVLQVWNHSSVSNLTKYSMTLGGSYTFARDDGDNITITAAGNYNFYFKIDGTTNYLYIVDVGEIADAGTLYLTSPQGTIGSITITTTNTKSEHPFNGVALSNVTGVIKESSTLKFGDGYVYSIPIFNLRGNDSSSPCTTVVLSWTSPSSGSVTLNDVDDLGGSAQHYYIDRSGTTGTASESKYIGLKVALDIDAAIQATPNTSVCEVDADIASDLCERYDKVTSAQGSSTLATSTIHTWAKVKGDSGDDIPMRSIRIELGNRSGDPKYSSAIRSFNPFSMINGEDGDNATTIIIIIAASVSLLSITALSILLVKKRKRVDN